MIQDYPTFLTKQKKDVFILIAFLISLISQAQNVLNFPTTTTWKCPTGVSTVTIQCWGGGGGGGGASAGLGTVTGGGGGGGGYASKAGAVTALTTYNINIGAGGTAGPASNAQAGSGGGTWFNTAATVFGAGGAGGFG